MRSSIRLLVPEALPMHFFAKIFMTNSLTRLRLIGRKKIHFIFLAVYLLSNYACVKEVPITDRHRRERHEETEVYVAGQIVDSADIFGDLFTKAVYWRNGHLIPLTDGKLNAGANAIAATRNDIYVAGYVGNVVALWKNGHYIPLTDGTNPGSASSIFISGQDVYVGGSEGTIAKYWKNGVEVSLTNAVSSNISSIFVEGNDVYAAGTITEDPNAFVQGGYWKNGQWVPLNDGNRQTSAHSIFVVGHDVYVAGGSFELNLPKSFAIYWKNGIPTHLDDISTRSDANSIQVVDRQIYICGSVLSNNFDPVFWKNNVANLLSGGFTYGVANSIVVSGNEVYVAGNATKNIAASIPPILWKNGIPEMLPTDSHPNAQANCVFVVKSESAERDEEKHFDGIGKY